MIKQPTNGGLLREERQHVDVDRVNRVEHVLRAAALLETKRELADRDGDVETRQVLLRKRDLLCELCMREDVVEERLRAELDHPRHELGLRVRVQSGEEGVTPAFPQVVAVEAELSEGGGESLMR